MVGFKLVTLESFSVKVKVYRLKRSLLDSRIIWNETFLLAIEMLLKS